MSSYDILRRLGLEVSDDEDDYPTTSDPNILDLSDDEQDTSPPALSQESKPQFDEYRLPFKIPPEESSTAYTTSFRYSKPSISRTGTKVLDRLVSSRPLVPVEPSFSLIRASPRASPRTSPSLIIASPPVQASQVRSSSRASPSLVRTSRPASQIPVSKLTMPSVQPSQVQPSQVQPSQASPRASQVQPRASQASPRASQASPRASQASPQASQVRTLPSVSPDSIPQIAPPSQSSRFPPLLKTWTSELKETVPTQAPSRGTPSRSQAPTSSFSSQAPRRELLPLPQAPRRDSSSQAPPVSSSSQLPPVSSSSQLPPVSSQLPPVSSSSQLEDDLSLTDEEEIEILNEKPAFSPAPVLVPNFRGSIVRVPELKNSVITQLLEHECRCIVIYSALDESRPIFKAFALNQLSKPRSPKPEIKHPQRYYPEIVYYKRNELPALSIEMLRELSRRIPYTEAIPNLKISRVNDYLFVPGLTERYAHAIDDFKPHKDAKLYMLYILGQTRWIQLKDKNDSTYNFRGDHNCLMFFKGKKFMELWKVFILGLQAKDEYAQTNCILVEFV